MHTGRGTRRAAAKSGEVSRVLTMAHGLRDASAVIITFLGTKGGTGTTTLAVNCAAQIHRTSSQPTILIDAKTSPGDVALFLGLRPRYSLVDVIDQVAWSDLARAGRYTAAHESGVHVLSAAEAFGRPNARDAEGVEQALACYASMYDHVVVDAGSTLSPTAVTTLTAADAVMLVANPDLPCLRNLQRLVDALRLAGVPAERLRVVLNRASDDVMVPVAQVEGALARTVDFQIPSDYRTVAGAINAGAPVSSLRPTDFGAQVEAMCRNLLNRQSRAAAS